MKNFVLIIILLLNFLLRIVGSDKSPASINWDEASLGYNAYSLLTTGKDDFGYKLPLTLRSFEDYKPALYSYLSIIPVKIMGLSQSSIRMISAIAGTLALIPLWWLLRTYIASEWLALIMVGLLGLGPLRLHFSRVALESNLSMAFFSFGVWWWIKGMKEKENAKLLLTGSLMMIGAVLSYHSARVAAPLLAIFLITDPLQIIIKKQLGQVNWKKAGLTAGVIIISVLTVMTISGAGNVTTRLGQENIGRFYPYISKEVFRGGLIDWIMNNPIYYLAGTLSGHALSFISPANFGPTLYHWIRNSVQFIPSIHYIGFIETIFFIPGLVLVLRQLKNREYRNLFYIFLAGVTPTVITWNWFHTLRAVNMLMVIEITAVVGIVGMLDVIKWKKVALGLLVVAFGFQSIFLVNNELVYAVTENYMDYQPGGFKEGVEKLMVEAKNAQKVIVDTSQAQGYIFLMFYGKYPPQEVQKYKEDRNWSYDNGSRDFNFDKFEFRKVIWAQDEKLKNTVLWTSPDITLGQVVAVGGKRWLVNGPLKEYKAAQIIKLP
ncbi:MAG: glycosyltransferase family 39 protein [Candidatus Shapirobacteria bacterium]